jgi:pyruvate ferredoxin oxidoreductase beta subunit
MPQYLKPKFFLSPGHRACAGCGQLLAARIVADTLGPETIMATATGCLEVTTTPYPETAWGMPWIHSLFENAAAVASGIYAALKTKGLEKKVKVVAQGGDGGTYDIGFGLISGMWERGEDILYICYDNEAYMNTGVQASGATPTFTHTTTTPAGKVSLGEKQNKKDLPAIAMAHGLSYVATATVGFPLDIAAKVKKAFTFAGPKYLQILVPCVPGWGYETNLTIKLGRLAQQTGLWPVFEAESGKITKVMKVPTNPPKVEEYLRPQKRYAHLFENEPGRQAMAEIQKLADWKIEKFGLSHKT